MRDFIDSIDDKTFAKVSRNMGVLALQGDRLKMPLAAPVTGYRFWELRAQAGGNIARVFYFAFAGRRMILLHGYTKKSPKAPRSELAVAARRMEDYLRRRR